MFMNVIINDNSLFLYSALSNSKYEILVTQSAQIITLAVALAATGSEAFQGINYYQVPIWIERDNRAWIKVKKPCVGADTLRRLEPPTLILSWEHDPIYMYL